jgi:hypothetical protein
MQMIMHFLVKELQREMVPSLPQQTDTGLCICVMPVLFTPGSRFKCVKTDIMLIFRRKAEEQVKKNKYQ